MTLPMIGSTPRFLEELRIGGGYGSAPDGGVDIDKAGRLAMSGDLTVDGDFTLDGALAFGSNGVDKTWSEIIPATAFLPAGASPVTAETFQAGDVVLPVIYFDDGVEEAACAAVPLPPDYDGSALRLTLYWTAIAGTSGNVKWHVLGRVFADGESLAQVTTAGSSFTDTFVAQNDLHEISTTYTPDGSTSGALMSLYLRRLGQQDSFDAPAGLLAARFEYA